MGRHIVKYYQVFCDYPDHGLPNQLSSGDSYRLLDGDKVVCDHCWDNKMTVERLFGVVNIKLSQHCVGKDCG